MITSINKRKLIILVCVICNLMHVYAGCLHPNNRKPPVKNKTSLVDTVLFYTRNVNAVKVLTFNDNNLIDIPGEKIKLIAKEETENSYTLTIKKKNKVIFSKKNIAGISKVWFANNYLAFSTYSYTDEDGNNEGSGYILNLDNDKVVTLARKLRNTCNPVITGDNIFFLNGLTLIKTNMNGIVLKNIYLGYAKKPYSRETKYLDRYTICQLSKDAQERLVVYFSPDRAKVTCQAFVGKINDTSEIVIFKDN